MKNIAHLLSAILLLTVLLLASSCSSSKVPTKSSVNLDEGAVQTVIDKVGQVRAPVTLRFYRGGPGEKKAEETAALLDLMKQNSPQIKIEEHNLLRNTQLMGDLGIKHGPVIIPKGPAPMDISYYGYPARKELAPFLDGVLIASGQIPRLAASTEAFLKGLDRDLNIKVFVSPD